MYFSKLIQFEIKANVFSLRSGEIWILKKLNLQLFPMIFEKLSLVPENDYWCFRGSAVWKRLKITRVLSFRWCQAVAVALIISLAPVKICCCNETAFLQVSFFWFMLSEYPVSSICTKSEPWLALIEGDKTHLSDSVQ